MPSGSELNLQDTVLKGKEIVIDDSGSFNAIGQGAVLKACTVHCRVPSQCLSIRGELLDCRIVVEQELVGFSWLEARVSGCTFQGRFKENEFGTLSGEGGRCQNAVFTDADLDDCTFYGDASDTHVFPGWPNIVIQDPHEHFTEMQSIQKSDALSDVVSSIEFLDEEATAVTFNADSLAERLHESPAAIKEFFSRFPFVHL